METNEKAREAGDEMKFSLAQSKTVLYRVQQILRYTPIDALVELRKRIGESFGFGGLSEETVRLYARMYDQMLTTVIEHLEAAYPDIRPPQA